MSFPMRKLIAIVLFLSCPALVAAAGSFLAGIEDVPVPPGFTENQAASMVFDSPTGRIIEAEAAGSLTREKVIAFYSETLPQLGWTRISDAEYRSDTETLKITFNERKKPLAVHYTLTPNF
jgi:hypothetical protein